MAKGGDILDMYGKNSSQPQVPSLKNGGANDTDMPTMGTVKTIPYDPPKGPMGINDPRTPGLHGTNHGSCGTQHK